MTTLSPRAFKAIADLIDREICVAELAAASRALADEAFKNMTGGKGHLIDDVYAALAKVQA